MLYLTNLSYCPCHSYLLCLKKEALGHPKQYITAEGSLGAKFRDHNFQLKSYPECMSQQCYHMFALRMILCYGQMCKILQAFKLKLLGKAYGHSLTIDILT
jgi:hypothetical protein